MVHLSDRQGWRKAEVILAPLAIALFAVFIFAPDAGDDLTVTLRNDTAHVVIFKQCGDTCSSFHDIERVRPNKSLPANTTVDVANWWKVTDESGNVLGCWPLLYTRYRSGLSVRVSEAVPCPTGSFNDGSDSLVGTILGSLVALLVVGVLLGNLATAIVGANRFMKRRLVRGTAEAILMVPVTILIVLGGWVIFDILVLFREGWRLTRPAARPT